jgi:predicted transcriptional regulator
MGKKVRKSSGSPNPTHRAGEQLRTTLGKEAALNALQKNLGIIDASAREVGITPKTLRQWIREDQEFANSVQDIRAASVDFVEGKLLDAIKQWKPGAAQLVQFYLKTQGRDRGYNERVDIQAKLESIEIEFKKTNL